MGNATVDTALSRAEAEAIRLTDISVTDYRNEIASSTSMTMLLRSYPHYDDLDGWGMALIGARTRAYRRLQLLRGAL
jgi:hypothetical protein